MKLWRLVYISRAVARMSEGELVDLVSRSRANNAKAGVTGLLLHSGGWFMQVLEGDRTAVTALFSRIAGDLRHTEVQELLSKAVDRRLFAEWGMQLANTETLQDVDRAQLEKRLIRLRLSGGDERASEVAALGLLDEFRIQLMKKNGGSFKAA